MIPALKGNRTQNAARKTWKKCHSSHLHLYVVVLLIVYMTEVIFGSIFCSEGQAQVES